MSNRPKIDPEIAGLLPPLSPEELLQLETSLREKDGCRDALVVWTETGILLDGHNRLAICEKYNIRYHTHHLHFPSRAAAIQWVIDNQLGRRNLTDERRAYYRGQEYLNQRKPHGGQVPGGSDQSDHSLPKEGKTAERVAEKHGVGPATVRRDAAFAQAVDVIGATDPQRKEEILAGRSGQTRGQVVAEARPRAPRVARPKRTSRAGQEVFRWQEFNKVLGRLVRLTDEIARAYESVNSPEHRNSQTHLKNYFSEVKVWGKRLGVHVRL
jgi:hypothetical protein